MWSPEVDFGEGDWAVWHGKLYVAAVESPVAEPGTNDNVWNQGTVDEMVAARNE